MNKKNVSNETQVVADIIRFHADNNPQKPAIVSECITLNYEALHQQSSQLANALIARGVKPHSRVAYLGKESEKYYVLLFACAKANLVLVPINWRLKINEISYILADSHSEALFVDIEFSKMVDTFAKNIVSLNVYVFLQECSTQQDYSQCIHLSPMDDPLLTVDKEDTLAQIYTSGTTGLPKGVELAHKSFFQIRAALMQNNLDWIDWREEDVSLIGIPGFHIGGLWWALQGFSAGLTNVSLPMFHATLAIDLIKKHKVTIACVVPAMINMILKEKESIDGNFTQLRKIVYGGSPISEALLQQAIEVLQCEFAQIYGLTETGNTAICLPPNDHIVGSKRLRAAGKPYPGVKIKIVNAEGQVLSVNQVGEIYLYTPARMKKYWNLPSETNTTLVNGWIRTGDAGYVDEEGYLFVCDRIKDMIIVAGEKIYPTEVENELAKHPAINDVAVIGVPHDEWGELVQAFVVLNATEKLTVRDLMLFLKSRIADYKIPAKFVFVDKIPRNPSGKILRRELRESEANAQKSRLETCS
ncbi:MAG: long-chain-fatty-acid--CoA ligase [Gammaproteobacteria bacterium]|nr:long-chain-fatty-acid--CoA ligase [Gammaproteobacteria bacterium]